MAKVEKGSPKKGSTKRSAKSPPPPARKLPIWVLAVGGTAVVLVLMAGLYLFGGLGGSAYEYRVDFGPPQQLIIHTAGQPESVVHKYPLEDFGVGVDYGNRWPMVTQKESGGWENYEITWSKNPHTQFCTAKVSLNGAPLSPSTAEAARMKEADIAWQAFVKKEGGCTVDYSLVGADPTSATPQLYFRMGAGGPQLAEFRIPNPPIQGEQSQADDTRVRWNLERGEYSASYHGITLPTYAGNQLALGRNILDDLDPQLVPRIDIGVFVRVRRNANAGPMAPVAGGAHVSPFQYEIIERATGKVLAAFGRGSPYDPPLPPGVWMFSLEEVGLVLYNGKIVPPESQPTQ